MLIVNRTSFISSGWELSSRNPNGSQSLLIENIIGGVIYYTIINSYKNKFLSEIRQTPSARGFVEYHHGDKIIGKSPDFCDYREIEYYFLSPKEIIRQISNK
jgi:hypothetical protein